MSLNRKCFRDYARKMENVLSGVEPNIHKFWSYTKTVLGTNLSNTVPPLLHEGNLITSSVDKAKAFNNYFSQQCSLSPADINHSLPPFQCFTHEHLATVHITPNDVYDILIHLNINKSVGPEGISNRGLRYAADFISVPLSNIFNNSLSSSTYPQAWKHANVSPVHKKGDRNIIEHYRPISLLCNISKVFERLIYNAVHKYLTVNKLLTTRNSGFKKGDSTICQLVSICHKIYTGLDNHQHVRMVFLDASKAFDKV